jgi:cytochrome P450
LRSYIALYGRKSGRYDLLTKLIAGDAARSISPLTDEEISIEVSNDVFAATDTTGNTMTYALYQLCCNPKWQQRLRNELRGSNGREKSWSFQSVQHLPILHAVIMETLRVYPAVPCGLPRITPPQGTKVGNLFIPGNVRCYKLHFPQRDPSISCLRHYFELILSADASFHASIHNAKRPYHLPKCRHLGP